MAEKRTLYMCRTIDRLPVRFRFITETVADYWMPRVVRCWRVTIRAQIAWPPMISERMH